MKTPSFFSCVFALGAASSILLSGSHAVGQTTVTTAPVGYLQTSCLSNSDTLVAPPFTRPAAFVGAVSSISGNTITLASSTLTADQYDAPTAAPPTSDTYYLAIGPATATLTGTVSVTSGSATVTGTGTTFGTDVKVGDRLTINDGYNLLTYTVTAIASTTSLTIDRAFADSAAGSTSTTTTVAKPAAFKTATVKGATVTKAAAITSATTLSSLSATYDHSPYEGRTYQVTTNGTSSVTVNPNGDTLTSIAAGTQVSIIPYWTLNSIFPASNAGISFSASSGSSTRLTQVLIPDYSTKGINLAAVSTYYFVSKGTNVGWRLYGDAPAADHGFDPLLPDGYFIVRTDSTAPTLPVTFTGSVPMNKQVITLATNSTTPQDNAVGLARPADVTINSLGLSPSDNSFQASTGSSSLVDQLLVYDNSQVAINKAATATYFYVTKGTNIGWRLYGDAPTADHGNDIIPASSGLTIRKGAVTGTAQNPVWTNSPNY